MRIFGKLCKPLHVNRHGYFLLESKQSSSSKWCENKSMGVFRTIEKAPKTIWPSHSSPQTGPFAPLGECRDFCAVSQGAGGF